MAKTKQPSAMSSRARSRQPDVFQTLLFKLPGELRLQIYEYLVPEEDIVLVPESSHWHWDLGTPGRSNRRSFRWLGVSRDVFIDAAPTIYSAKTLYFWIDARTNGRGRTLDDALKHHVKLAHPEDIKWSLDLIRSKMLTKVMLEVHMATSGENLQSVLVRFSEMSSQFRRYTAIRYLYISLRPHYNNAHHRILFRSFKVPHLQEKTVRESWTMRRMCRAVRQVKLHLPVECEVKWYLPGTKLPRVPYKRRDYGEAENPWDVMESEIMVMDFMQNMWEFVCNRTDDQLDELLSERDFRQTSMTPPGKIVS